MQAQKILWGVKIVYVKMKKGEGIYLELIRIVVKKPVTAFEYNNVP